MNSTFEPQVVTIKVGQTVHWAFQNGKHNVVSGLNCIADRNFNSGPTVGAGAAYDGAFDTAGRFDSFCDPHCDHMTGKVIVE